MKSVVAVFLLLFAVFQDVLSSQALPQTLDAYKHFRLFSRPPNKWECFVYHYKITLDHGDTGLEPMRNFAPMEVYDMDNADYSNGKPLCAFEEDTTTSMNIVKGTNSDQLVLATCTHFLDIYQCWALTAKNPHDRFIFNKVHDKRFLQKKGVMYFYINPRSYDNSIFYCMDKECISMNGRSKTTAPANPINEHRQYNQVLDIDVFRHPFNRDEHVFSFDDLTMFYHNNYLDIYHLSKSQLTSYPVESGASESGFYYEMYQNGRLSGDKRHVSSAPLKSVWLANQYDFVHKDSSLFSSKSLPNRVVNVYSIFPFNKKRYLMIENMLAHQNTRFDYEIPKVHHVSVSMTHEWNLREQTGYVRICWVATKSGLHLECFRAGGLRNFDKDIEHYFGKCLEHLDNNMIYNIVIGALNDETSIFQKVHIETATMLCVIDFQYEPPLEELIERPKYTVGYNPVRNVMLERADDGSFDGIPIPCSNNATMFSLGDYVIFRCDISNWKLLTPERELIPRRYMVHYVAEAQVANAFMSANPRLGRMPPPRVKPHPSSRFDTTAAPTAPQTTTLPPTTTLAATTTLAPTTTVVPTTDPPATTKEQTATAPPTTTIVPSTTQTIPNVQSQAPITAAASTSSPELSPVPGTASSLVGKPLCHYFYDSLAGMVTVYVFNLILFLLLVLTIFVERRGSKRQKLAKQKHKHQNESATEATTTFMTQQDVTVIPSATTISKKSKKKATGKKGKKW